MHIKRASLLLSAVAIAAAVVAVGWLPALNGPWKKSAGPSDLSDGDILFQDIGGGQSDAIALATQCHWTHVGIAFRDNGKWMVYEAVGPVKKTPLSEWIGQGHGHYVVKRWNERAKLDAATVAKLKAAATPYMGRAYDWQFLWSDEKIYCSELVWKMYEEGLGVRLCEPKALKDWHLNSDLVQRTMKERYGSALPLDEPMVAPATLFQCPSLVTVLER